MDSIEVLKNEKKFLWMRGLDRVKNYFVSHFGNPRNKL